MQNSVKNWPPFNTESARSIPQNQETWQKLAIEYTKSGYFSAAAASFEQALSIHTEGLSEILTNLAVVYWKMGKPEMAESCLLDALAESPEDARIWGILAKIMPFLNKNPNEN